MLENEGDFILACDCGCKELAVILNYGTGKPDTHDARYVEVWCPECECMLMSNKDDDCEVEHARMMQ